MEWLWKGLILKMTLNTENIIAIFNIGAMILTGVLGAVVTGGIGYFFGIRNIRRDLGVGTEAPVTKQHSTMQEQHRSMQETLSGQHRSMQENLSGQYGEIRQSLSAIGQKTRDVSDVLLEEKMKQEHWHSNLSESQKELKSSADRMGQFATEFGRIANEVAELRKENERLRIENTKLEERYSALIGRIQAPSQSNANDDWELER